MTQTTVTTNGGTSNSIPKFTGSSTISNSQIFDNSTSVGVGTANPESYFHVLPPTTAQYVKFSTAPWGLRIGALQAGQQFISLGVNKTAADNSYVAKTGDDPAVSHSVLEMGYDGSLRFKVQGHQPDGTTLNLSDRFVLDSAGRVGFNTSAPESQFEVKGTSAQWAKFNFGSPWGLRIGALQSGTQFLSMGVGKAGIDSNYVALTGNEPTVNHSVVEMRADGSIGLKQQSHQSDGTILNMAERFTVGPTGYVGIGTTSPQYKLDVNGTMHTSGIFFPDNTFLGSGAVGTITGVLPGSGLTGGGYSGNVSLALDNTVPRSNTTNYFSSLQVYNGGIQSRIGSTFQNVNLNNIADFYSDYLHIWVMSLYQNADLHVAGGVYTHGADFAESVEVVGDKSNFGPGGVMAIDEGGGRKFKLSDQPYSTLVAGIYSATPGIIASQHSMDDAKLAQEIPLAVVGIVPCKDTDENGPIKLGDLLVTSSTPGFAMKGTDRTRLVGAVVGKALDPLPTGKGAIRILVSLQ